MSEVILTKNSDESTLATMTWKLRWAIYRDGSRLEQMWNVEHHKGGKVVNVTEEWRRIPNAHISDWMPDDWEPNR